MGLVLTVRSTSKIKGKSPDFMLHLIASATSNALRRVGARSAKAASLG